MKLKITFLFLLATATVIAQQEANHWFFGQGAGLNFSTGTPLAVAEGQLKTDEGCAVIADKAGRLLFYTDGISVWNRNHALMTNGQSLKGNPSSTSSGVAIPKPKSVGTYYLFTVAATAGEDGICYSRIEMTQDSGLGAVVADEKNVKLKAAVTEKMTAVVHRNGTDFWVIAHAWNSDEFLAYLVSEKGVNTTPVVSKVGSVHTGTTLNTQGYMKSNPDGSNLALVLEETDVLEVFDFDNATGIVSQPISVKFPPKCFPYGVEFSPDGSILYSSAAGNGEVYQFNLQAGSVENIQKSMRKIGQTANKEWTGALQLANDGKIYFTIYNTEYLGVIEKPNEYGDSCRYRNNAVKLNGKMATLGLPTFTQSFLTQEVKAQEIYHFNPDKLVTNKNVILNNVRFDFSKSVLKSESFPELKKVAAIMTKNPSYSITLIGHTDNIGNKSFNIELSQNRAKAVQDYLISQGVKAERIQFEGKGSGVPIASNLTEAGRAKNRRVEFVIKK